jgi:hypothetical protein
VERFDHFGFQLIIARSLQPFDIHPHGFGFIELLENGVGIVSTTRQLSLLIRKLTFDFGREVGFGFAEGEHGDAAFGADFDFVNEERLTTNTITRENTVANQ